MISQLSCHRVKIFYFQGVGLTANYHQKKVEILLEKNIKILSYRLSGSLISETELAINNGWY